jgi:hypothetical protein
MKHPLIPFLLLCAFGSPSAAQSVAGSGAVSGRVWETSTEGLPEAKVALDNDKVGIHRIRQSTLDGIFSVTGLAPAAGYKLKVTRKDFVDWESEEFEVLAGQTVTFNITLRAEAAAPEKDATPPAAPRGDESHEGVGAVVTALEIESLPLRGRRPDDLTLLAPAAALNQRTGEVMFPGRPPGGSVLMDGLLSGRRFPAAETATLAGTSIEAIQGFQVLPGGAPPEFGHTMSGVVNAISRSGSNAFHGSLFSFFSNDSLTAPDRYALGRRLFRNSSQSGVSAGGPAVRDKVFFYANAELWDSRYQGLNRLSSPLLSDASGAAIDTSNCLASAAQCAAAAAFLRGQMNALEPRFRHWVAGSARIDYRRGSANAFSVSANKSRDKSPEGGQYGAVAPNGGLIGNGLSTGETTGARAEWTALPLPGAVNEARAGYFRDRRSTLASQPLAGIGSVGVLIGEAAVGTTRAYPSLINEERVDLADNFRWNMLNHSFMIGGQWLKTRYRLDELSDLAGTYLYPTLTAFAQDFSGGGRRSYSSFTQTLANPVRTMPVKEWNVYAQDSWQPRRNLRLTAGFRLERWLPPQPPMANANHYQTGEILSRLRAGPRIGISYAPDERTAVRLGFGYYHSSPSGALLDALYLGNGEDQPRLTVTPDQTGAPVFPGAVSRANIPAGTKNLMWAAKEAKNPYASQYSAAVERSLGFETSLTVGYVGSTGIGLWVANDMNLTTDVKSATYTINNAGGQKAGEYTTDVWTTRSETPYAHLYNIKSTGKSSYHALSAQLRRPLAQGLSFGAAYTWSHAIDDTGGAPAAGGLPMNSRNGDPSADRGNSATDQRHRLVIDWVWRPKLGDSGSMLARYLANGWEVSSITTLASAQPSTALVLVNGQQFSGINMAFPTTLNGGGGWARVPFLPVGSLYAEPARAVNARVAKSVPLGERIQGKLLFEAFNLADSQYATSVNTIAYVATGGVLTPVPRLGAGNAAHGYPNGSNARSCQVAFRLQF